MSRNKKDIIEEAIHCIESYNYQFAENIDKFEKSKLFYMGKQWDDQARINYTKKGNKKAFTFNIVFRIVNQLIGQIINLRPGVSLSADNPIAKRQIKLVQDLLRRDAFGNEAMHAYQIGAKNQIAASWGAVKVDLYEPSPISTHEEIKICPIEEPQKIFWDVTATDPHYITGQYCGGVEYIAREKFIKMYGKDKVPKHAINALGLEDIQPTHDKIPVINFYKREFKKSQLFRVYNGVNFDVEVEKSKVDSVVKMYDDMVLAHQLIDKMPELIVTKIKDIEIPCINEYILTDTEILEKNEWPSNFLPYVFIPGYRNTVHHEITTQSFIEPAMDAQTSFNMIVSEIINGSIKSRKGMLAIHNGSIEAEEAEAVLQHADEFPQFLLVKDGHPMPVYFAPDSLPADFYKQQEIFKSYIYEILGIYPREKGIVPANTAEGTLNTALTQENLAFAGILSNFQSAQVAVAKICLDLIPKIYHQERQVHLLTASGKPYSVTINKRTDRGYQNLLIDVDYNLSIHEVASFVQEEQQSLKALQELMASDPVRAQALAPMFAKRLNLPESAELEEILLKIMSPQVKAKLSGAPTQPSPEQIEAQQKQQLAQEEMQIKKMKLIHDIRNDKVKNKLAYIKQQVEAREGQTDLLKAIIETQAEIEKAQLDNLDTGLLNKKFEQKLLEESKNYDNIIK